MNKTASLAFVLTAFATAAQAHQIWIEQPDGQAAQIRFGEFAENVREVSPGALDKLGATRATLISPKGEKTADGAKTGSGFALPFKAGQGEAIVAEAANYPLYQLKKDGETLTNWYYPTARLVTGFAPQAPVHTLDLVPAGKPGQLQVFFRGKPLAKAKVTLVTQSGWGKQLHADEQGKVAFDMPWKGLYVAEVSHDDHTPGERQGANGSERYNGVNYVSTLTYRKPDGLAPIPVAAAAANEQAAGK